MTGNGLPATSQPAARLDAWLWHARILSTRGACARLVIHQGIRINGRSTDKPDARVRPGDVLTFAIGQRVRVLRIAALAERRGPASEAARLYLDLAPSGSSPGTLAQGQVDGHIS